MATINKIKNICKSIYAQLGPGMSEFAYQRALELELTIRGLGVCDEYLLTQNYRDSKGRIHCVTTLRADLIIFDLNLILELKAVNKLSYKDELQAKKYKELSCCKVLLVNFGYHNIEFKEF